MWTIIRRTLVIFVLLVIAFFVYSAFDPQGAGRLISIIKGSTGSISTGIVITDLSGSSQSGIVVVSETGTESGSGSWWSRLVGTSNTGSSSTGSLRQSGSVANNTGTSSGLSVDFLESTKPPTVSVTSGSSTTTSTSTSTSTSTTSNTITAPAQTNTLTQQDIEDTKRLFNNLGIEKK